MSQPVQQAMMPLQVALGALLTKSVGSIYRIRDVREAPPLIQANVKHREAVIMTAATVFSLVVQAVLSINKIRTLIEKSPIAKYAILFQSALMAGALCLGELTGRYMTPPLDWHEVEVQEVHETPGNQTETVTPEKRTPERTVNGKENKTMTVGFSQAAVRSVLTVPDYWSSGNYSAKSRASDVLSATDHSTKGSSVAFGQSSALKMSGNVGVPQRDKVRDMQEAFKLNVMA